MTDADTETLDLAALTGIRRGPYRSFNAVSRAQVWQWCSAMDDRNPLYLDDDYRNSRGLGDRVIAPPAMMQMWTMRDVNMQFAAGSTAEPPYAVFDTLCAHGFTSNVAVSYDIHFHRLLEEGDRAHHYTSIASISPRKQTALGSGHFVTERAEFFDQADRLYAEAFITYLQYRSAAVDAASAAQDTPTTAAAAKPSARADSEKPAPPAWQPDFRDLHADTVQPGMALPALVLPITHKLIVSGALASQDFIDVHHNAPAARAAAMPDIFMNILTTCGLTGRYLTDWAGPGSRLRRLALRLAAPNVPGDTMVLSGSVKGLEQADGEVQAVVEFSGQNSRGMHVGGEATLALAG